MTSDGFGEMFEGASADRCAGKFPLISMGGRAEGLECADPGARSYLDSYRYTVFWRTKLGLGGGRVGERQRNGKVINMEWLRIFVKEYYEVFAILILIKEVSLNPSSPYGEYCYVVIINKSPAPQLGT